MDSLPGQLPNDDYYSQYGIGEGNGHMDSMTVFDTMGMDDMVNGLDSMDSTDSMDSHFLMNGHMASSKPATSPSPYTAGLPTPTSVSATPEATTAAVDAPPMPAGFPPSFFENGEHTQKDGGQNGGTQGPDPTPAHIRNDQRAALPFQQHPEHPQHPPAPRHHDQHQQPQQPQNQTQIPAHLLQNLPPAFANNPHAQALLQQNPLLFYQLVQMQQTTGPQGAQGVHGQDGHSQHQQNGGHGQPPSALANAHTIAERCLNGHAPQSGSGSPSLHSSQANTATNTASSVSDPSHANTTSSVSPNTAMTASASSSTAATATTPDDLRLQDLSIVPATHSQSQNGHGHGPGPVPGPLTSSASTATIIGPQSTASSTTSRPPPPAAGPPHPPHPYMNHPPPPHHGAHRSASSPIHNSSHSHPHSVPPVPALPPQHLQQQIPLPPPPHTSSSHTLSPKKQRAPSASAASASASTSPKKPGRFENIYATIRKATTMRRSRAAFMNEAPAPTVAPMALLRDNESNTSKNNSNNNNNRNPTAMSNSKAHAHFRSHHPGDLDLDLSANANGFPMTPPLTGNGSSLSSTSSTFSSTSASSSLASSFDAQNQMHSHPLMMQPTPIHFGVNQCINGDDDLSAADLASFGMSGLVVDDPFVDSSAFFGGGQPIKADPSAHDAISTACWPESTTATAMATTPMSSMDDNESTPVSHATTAAINIPSSRGMVSPTACLADATAAMSGNSLIAAANAAAMLKCESGAMETDDDWWQQSVVESAVGDANGLPYFGDNNAVFMQQNVQNMQDMQNMPGMEVNCAPNGSFYPMPDMATQGLMIAMPPNGDFQQQQQQQQQNQYYFPNVTTGGFASVPMVATHSAPHYSVQQPQMEFRRDRASNTPRRSKPRAPSAGARHLQPGGGSPRKRLGRGPSSEDLNSAYIYSGAGNAAAMTTPNTPRSHANGARRSASMQSLSCTSPTPSHSTMPSVPPMPSTPSHNQNGVRKRRSASSMRRVSSGQSCGSVSGAPRTPMRRASAEPSRPQSSSGGGNIGFVNFTPDDKKKLMAGVAPSGSSKTKERRDRELKEKTRKLMQAVVQAGGDMNTLEAQGLRDIGIKI